MHELINWWQYLPEQINPNLLEIGNFPIRYYGLIYLVAFAVTYQLILYRIAKEKFGYAKETIWDYFVWVILGVLLGGRVGYVLFYNFNYYLKNPLEIFLPFSFSHGIRYTGISGMSYHGGLAGVIVSSLIFCLKHKINFLTFSDLVIPAIPLGYTLGRIGNFVNGELYGRVTAVFWGMYFPADPTLRLRHPSQLYEAFFEGILLFFILWSIRKKKHFSGFFLSLYLILYGTFRFFLEFFREPDPQLGFIGGYFTMGQILCLAMIFTGLIITLLRFRMKDTTHNTSS